VESRVDPPLDLGNALGRESGLLDRLGKPAAGERTRLLGDLDAVAARDTDPRRAGAALRHHGALDRAPADGAVDAGSDVFDTHDGASRWGSLAQLRQPAEKL